MPVNTSGTQSVAATFNYETNTGPNQRSSEITLSSEGVDPVIITVTQEAWGGKIYLTKKMKYNSDNSSNGWTEYIYDDSWNMTEMKNSNETRYVYEYNSQGQIIKESYHRKNSVPIYYSTYEYDSNEHLEKEVIYYDFGKIYNIKKEHIRRYNDIIAEIDKKNAKEFVPYTYFIYTYNETGVLIKRAEYDSTDEHTAYTNYEFDRKGNKIKQLRYRISNNSEYKLSEYTYIFDNKNSIFKNVNFPVINNVNNVLTNNFQLLNEDGTTLMDDTYSYTYEYNENDYPIKRTDQAGEYSTYEYEYVVTD